MSVAYDRTLRETTLRGMTISWVQGFLSGALFAMGRSGDSLVTRTPDGEAIAQWLTNYCQQHPLQDLSEGSIVLLREMTGVK